MVYRLYTIVILYHGYAYSRAHVHIITMSSSTDSKNWSVTNRLRKFKEYVNVELKQKKQILL